MGKTSAQEITAFGVTYKSILALCKAHNISSTTFRQRRERGMSIEKALTEKAAKFNAAHITVDNVFFETMSKALLHFGVSREIYEKRRENMWARHTACSTPGEETDIYFEPIEFEGVKTLDVLSVLKATGVPKELFDKRVARRWGKNRAALMPPEILNMKAPAMFPEELRSVMETFFQESQSDGDCLVWPGKLAKSGLVEVYALRKRYSVPRLVYCLYNDIHPSELSTRVTITQSCKNPRCLKDEHMIAALNRNRSTAEARRLKAAEEERDNAEPLPEEVLKAARALRATGWADTRTLAEMLGVTRERLERFI